MFVVNGYRGDEDTREWARDIWNIWFDEVYPPTPEDSDYEEEDDLTDEQMAQKEEEEKKRKRFGWIRHTEKTFTIKTTLELMNVCLIFFQHLFADQSIAVRFQKCLFRLLI